LDDAQTMLRRFMEFEGFTVGIKDCMLSAPAPLLGNVDFGTDEMSARIELQQEMMAIGDTVQKDPKAIGNRFTAMMKAGSKGSTTNLTQICGIVGQQLVNGQRIHNDFPHRTLAHFQKYDNTATARGYVQGNYINGLNPIEFFFHAAGGREGLTGIFNFPCEY
jgi:DNA-directed RNA polymerase beta' subunit